MVGQGVIAPEGWVLASKRKTGKPRTAKAIGYKCGPGRREKKKTAFAAHQCLTAC